MLQHLCDSCGQILSAGDTHYRLSISWVPSGSSDASASGADSLDVMAQLLDGLEAGEIVDPGKAEFELCAACQRRHRSDPLGKQRVSNARFSPN